MILCFRSQEASEEEFVVPLAANLPLVQVLLWFYLEHGHEVFVVCNSKLVAKALLLNHQGKGKGQGKVAQNATNGSVSLLLSLLFSLLREWILWFYAFPFLTRLKKKWIKKGLESNKFGRDMGILLEFLLDSAPTDQQWMGWWLWLWKYVCGVHGWTLTARNLD